MIKIDKDNNNEFNINDEESEDNIYDKFSSNFTPMNDEEINNLLSGNLDGIDPETLENLDKQIRDIMSKLPFDINKVYGQINNENGEGPGIAFTLGQINSEKNKIDPNKKRQKNTSNKTKRVQVEENKKDKRRFLNTFAENLTEKALAGELDRVIGRENEIRRTVEILNRRSKNNPVLIGEPGVRKNCNSTRFSTKNY